MLAKDYLRVGGRFATLNNYQSAFDPQFPVDFKYLITIRIRKGTLDAFELLDDILRDIGVVADRDIASGSQHHMITALVVTTLRSFTCNALVKLEGNKFLHVELDFYKHYLRCTKCFSPEHDERVCDYYPPRLVAPTDHVELT